MEELFLTPREQGSNFGFAIWKARPRPMTVGHQHNDVEVNYVERGYMTYLYGGRRVVVDQGSCALFWAARIHQLVDMSDDTYFHGFTVPLGWFLGWQFPCSFTRAVLRGELLVPPHDETVTAFCRQVDRWTEDLSVDSAERRRVMLLEIEAWFYRASLSLHRVATGAVSPETGRGPMRKVETMARFITEHYTEPLSVSDVAEAAALHPNYAVRLFRESTGSTLVDFITKQRIAHAQHQLVTTHARVLDIGLEAGFGSASRFYAAFKRALGLSPNEYRAMIRLPRPGS